MSYCRKFDGCQLYLFTHIDGYIACYGCKLTPIPREDKKFYTRSETIEHLKEHKKSKHKFPYQSIIKQLKEEIKELGDKVEKYKFEE